MTHFWDALSDDAGLELFGRLWPRDGEQIKMHRFLRRVDELGDGAMWPAALGALAAVVQRTDSDKAKARCFLEAARIAVRWEEPVVARAAGIAALELGDEDDDHIDVLLQLGYSASDLGESDLAFEVYAVCRRHMERIGDRGGVAHVDMNVAIVHNGLGRHELAAGLHADAAATFDELGDTDDLLSCWSNMVGSVLDAGRPREALLLADRVVELRRSGSDELLTAHAVFNRSRIFFDLEEWEPAREGWIEALETYRKLGLPTEQADCLDVLGSVARHDGLLEFAEQMHLEALRLYAGRHHPVDEAQARENLAVTYIHMGRYAEAIGLCDLATGVSGTDLDPGMAKAAALDGMGDTKAADRLRSEWLERHGVEYYEQALSRLP
jgi:tetratricopeptide (TPR) repeat protein